MQYTVVKQDTWLCYVQSYKTTGGSGKSQNIHTQQYVKRAKEIDRLQWGASEYLGAQFKRDVFFNPTGMYNG